MVARSQCYRQALNIFGNEMSVYEIANEVLADKVFYEQSGGDVTISGGEPMRQAQFVLALLQMCKLNNINTAIETSGLFNWQGFISILNLLDYLLVDLKTMNTQEHTKYTGVNNDIILTNIKKILSQEERSSSSLSYIPVIIRIPIIPNINDKKENLETTAKFLAANNKKNILQYIDLLPYHEYGKHKYQGLGIPYKMNNISQKSTTIFDEAKTIFNHYGLLCKINGL